MLALAVYGFLLGSVLGIWYRVFVLVPTIVTGALVIAAVAAFQGAELSRTALAMVVLGLLVQAGYAGAIMIQHFVMARDWIARPSLSAAVSPAQRKPRAH